MKVKFLKPNDPRLKKVAIEVPETQLNSSQIKKIADLMLKIIHDEQKSHKRGIGLAAPQIGILKRIILVDVATDGKGEVGNLRIYINPEIVWKSKKEGEWYEGCYSTGKICGIISRPTSIIIKALNITQEKYTGYVARIFQLHLVEKKEFPLYRNKEAWRNWPKKASLPLDNQALKKV